MNNYMVGVMLLLGFVFLGRAIHDRAVKKLELDKKSQLIDISSQNRNLYFGILIGLLGIFFLNIQLELIELKISYYIFMLLLFVYITVVGFLTYRKLKDNEFPDSFIKSYLLMNFVRVLGLVVFVVVSL